MTQALALTIGYHDALLFIHVYWSLVATIRATATLPGLHQKKNFSYFNKSLHIFVELNQPKQNSCFAAHTQGDVQFQNQTNKAADIENRKYRIYWCL